MSSAINHYDHQRSMYAHTPITLSVIRSTCPLPALRKSMQTHNFPWKINKSHRSCLGLVFHLKRTILMMCNAIVDLNLEWERKSSAQFLSVMSRHFFFRGWGRFIKTASNETDRKGRKEGRTAI